MQFVDALAHRHRLLARTLPDHWQRVEVRCPACGRVFVGHMSPRDSAREAQAAARVRLIRTCPHHQHQFSV